MKLFNLRAIWAPLTFSFVLFWANQPALAAETTNSTLVSKPAKPKTETSNWADFVEKDFPFFSSVLDARAMGEGWPTNNLTPRGLILNLGNGCWACFDTDLLRVSALWTGAGVTPVSMSQGSYHVAGLKAREGQDKLPQIAGTPWLANGIYPGWQSAENTTLTDPRTPAPDPKEVGRGPLAPQLGRFKAVRLVGQTAQLEYEIAGVPVQEWMEARMQEGQPVIQRCFQLDAPTRPLTLILGQQPTNSAAQAQVMAVLTSDRLGETPLAEIETTPSGLMSVRVRASKQPVAFRVALSKGIPPRTWNTPQPTKPSAARWPQTLTTHGQLSADTNAYVMDNIALPLQNPWRRNVRFADLAFFNDGRAAAVTFDGDVWLLSGLEKDLGRVQWKRFASGLHEPLAISIRNEEIFVFDRNGLWQLRDTDHNGEADAHELFANNFAQTAETREFATGMRVAPDGSFVLTKGGQQSSTTGIHNGTVLRISPDGQTTTVLGWGLRMPFLGVHPKTGLVTASDQQGNYVPATPLHVIADRHYYGFLTGLMPKEKYPAPITDALTWIPHAVNASAAGQAWLTDAKMGPLNDAFINVGYYRPELFLVLLNQRSPETQAAVMSLTRDFEFAPLNAAVSPLDGQLYVIGFQIWGTTAKQVSGLARLRYTGAPSPFPSEVVPMNQGVLLKFAVPLDLTTATNLGNYSVERWNYRRTAAYGSPHYKLDGTPGQETMPLASAYLSADGRSVFLGIPDMKEVMQMRVAWTLTSAARHTFGNNAYFTVHHLDAFSPQKEGFAPFTVDLTPRAAQAVAATPQTVEEGQRLATLMACVACHSADGSTLGKVGPTWKNLFGHEVELADGRKVLADEAYLRESIIEPTAKVVAGFDKSDAGMPSYQGVINDAQVDALLLYIKSLR